MDIVGRSLLLPAHEGTQYPTFPQLDSTVNDISVSISDGHVLHGFVNKSAVFQNEHFSRNFITVSNLPQITVR